MISMTSSLTQSKIMSGTASKFRQGHSLPPLTKTPKVKVGQYIQNSLKFLQSGCYQNGRLKIDGSIGDYRMSIFRVKDRNRIMKSKPTFFTSQITKRLSNIAQSDPQNHSQIMQIIKTPVNTYHQKMKQIQEQKKKILGPQPMKKGIQQTLRQQDQALIYEYLPKQEKNWFQTIDNTQQYQLKLSQLRMKLSALGNNASIHTAKKAKPKKKYLFKYQDPNCIFNNGSNFF